MKLVAAVVILTVLPAIATPEDLLVLPPGIRVRVRSSDAGIVTGRIHAADAQAISIEGKGGRIEHIPREAVRQLEIGSFGRGHRKIGAVFGALAGSFGLAALSAVTAPEDCPHGCGYQTLLAFMVGGAAGGWGGSALGSRLTTERWMTIPLDRVRPAPSSAPVALRISFLF